MFEVNTDGSDLTTLHSFTTRNYQTTISDGANPRASLVSSGNTLYGAASAGGSWSNGTIYAVNNDGTGYTNLYNFTALQSSTNGDGAQPYGTLVLSGNTLYGTARLGGSGHGTVFSVNTNGTGFVTLHTFTGGSGGANPNAGLILSGNTLYGTAGNIIVGTVFKLNTDGTGFAILQNPIGETMAGLALSGNTLYGTTIRGGISNNGTVFAVNTDGTGSNTIHNFIGSDGMYPGTLVLSGNTLYGFATQGGISNAGTIFKIQTDGTGYTTLYSFTRGADGLSPDALIYAGNALYGTTSGFSGVESGTIFRMNADGTGFATLFAFAGPGSGPDPEGLILSGNTLYGTTLAGGSFGNGTVFSLALEPLSAPQLAVQLNAGVLGITASGLYSGESVVLQTSTNLPNWTPLSTNVATGPTLMITNAIDPAVSAQFFRAVGQ